MSWLSLRAVCLCGFLLGQALGTTTRQETVSLGRWLLDDKYDRLLLPINGKCSDGPPDLWTNNAEISLDQIATSFLDLAPASPQASSSAWFDTEIKMLSAQAAGNASSFRHLLEEWQQHEADASTSALITAKLKEVESGKLAVNITPATTTAPPEKWIADDDESPTITLKNPATNDEIDSLVAHKAFADSTAEVHDARRQRIPRTLAKGRRPDFANGPVKVALGGALWAIALPLLPADAAAASKTNTVGAWRVVNEALNTGLAGGGDITALLKPVSQEVTPAPHNKGDDADVSTTTTTTTTLKPAKVSDVLSWLRGAPLPSRNDDQAFAPSATDAGVPADGNNDAPLSPAASDASSAAPSAKAHRSKADWLTWKPPSADSSVAAVIGGLDGGSGSSADSAHTKGANSATHESRPKGDWLAWRPPDASSSVSDVLKGVGDDPAAAAIAELPATLGGDAAAPAPEEVPKSQILTTAQPVAGASPAVAVPPAKTTSTHQPPSMVAKHSKSDWLAWKPPDDSAVVAGVLKNLGLKVPSGAAPPAARPANNLVKAKPAAPPVAIPVAAATTTTTTTRAPPVPSADVSPLTSIAAGLTFDDNPKDDAGVATPAGSTPGSSLRGASVVPVAAVQPASDSGNAPLPANAVSVTDAVLVAPAPAKDSSSELASLQAADPASYNVIKALLSKRQAAAAHGIVDGAAIDPLTASVSGLKIGDGESTLASEMPEPAPAVSASLPYPEMPAAVSATVSAAVEVPSTEPDRLVKQQDPAAIAEHALDFYTGAMGSGTTLGALSEKAIPSAPVRAVTEEPEDSSTPVVPATPSQVIAASAGSDDNAVKGLLEQVHELTGKSVPAHSEVEEAAQKAEEQAAADQPKHTSSSWASIVESDPSMRIIEEATHGTF